MGDWTSQQWHRERAKEETLRRGYREGGLQWLWRTPDCFKQKYDQGEVVAAICDALCREGQTAWPGDGTSCVEQMIRLQWERAERAEAQLIQDRGLLVDCLTAVMNMLENPIVQGSPPNLESWRKVAADLRARLGYAERG